MSWYSKYYDIYGKDPSSLDDGIMSTIKGKMTKAISDNPLASVVVIAHNEEKRILACLWSLLDNERTFDMEIVVIDNNSTDSTSSVLNSIGARTFFESRQSPGYARQCGLDHAKGKYHLCIDADTIYPPHYIATMVKSLQVNNVVAVYGLWSFLPDKELSPTSICFYELLRDTSLVIQNIKRPELVVRGMVFAFDTELGRKYGFRTDIIRGEDGSLALNLKTEGKIHLCLSRKCRPITDNSLLKRQGSIMGALRIRIVKLIKSLPHMFVKETHYEDKEDNLIKRQG